MSNPEPPGNNDPPVRKPCAMKLRSRPVDELEAQLRTVEIRKEQQRTIEQFFRALVTENLPEEDFRNEIVDTIVIENFTQINAERNRDFLRRISKKLEDIGLITNHHALAQHEILGRRIMRCVSDRKEARSGIELLMQVRREIQAEEKILSAKNSPNETLPLLNLAPNATTTPISDNTRKQIETGLSAQFFATDTTSQDK